MILCHLTSEPRHWTVLGQSAMVVQRCAEAWQPRCDQLANTIQSLVVKKKPTTPKQFCLGVKKKAHDSKLILPRGPKKRPMTPKQIA